MLRLLSLLLALGLLAACGAQPTPQGGPARSEPAQIDTVTVHTRESNPVQVVAQIQGQLGNGCMSLGQITQRREGNLVEVTVLANHSGAEVCTMQLQLIDQELELEGPFAPGDYLLRVNGVEQPFSV